ncbi:MAG TPA: hydroxyphenylacetyl-CoA thioesterase PaaI [Aestuariivirgaceae bacterium]|nr:hydroxyphenylacetyl-CoA thioesterase PaaI [Aestuariivirgaceae bacterium]
MTEPRDPQALAEACAAAMWARDQASRGLGMALERIAPGEAVLAMTVRGDMVNGHDICHGGFIFTLADSAFAFACNSYDVSTVAASCDIAFLKAARLGDRLRAVAREVYREGRNGIYDIVVTGRTGGTVAHFRGKSRTIGGPVIEENRHAHEAG